jgi:glyoxylase-like metal-dependent hydrolase (beta-lactamase superfamily II)
MKSIISFLIFLFLSQFIFAQAQNNKLNIKHLTGNYYIFITYSDFKGTLFPANGMYVITEKGAIMIDTPWDTTQFQPLLDSIKQKHNKEVLMCIATHSHEDRTGGLEFLRKKGVRTYTTRKTDQLCAENGANRAEFLIENDTTFAIGSSTFQTYYAGEGHTPDNIVVWFEKERVLYGGCLVKSTDAQNLGFTGDANIEAWTKTIQQLQTKFPNPKFIIPGHQSWKSKKSLVHTLKLIKKHVKAKK